MRGTVDDECVPDSFPACSRATSGKIAPLGLVNTDNVLDNLNGNSLPPTDAHENPPAHSSGATSAAPQLPPSP